MSSQYDAHFFAAQQDGSIRSAKEIIPIVLRLLDVGSAADVGCGTGGWLAVCKEQGVREVLGIDGEYIDESMRHIAPDEFRSLDLSQPFDLGRTFDLVISLEVGEHLPEQAARTYVDSLTKHGQVVLFSAAIPYQGGKHHVNEQWQSYWAELFGSVGYAAVDCIRQLVWDNPNVQWWYAQNTIVYVKKSELSRYPRLVAEYRRQPSLPLSVVHPKLYSLLAKDFFGDDGYQDGMIVGRTFTPRM
ncbi:class I SAM-dependent methyltransferase [Paenibacillus sp.]|uniref:class I SAM-dependent methyltransferase n=1 Tax=Paenibacillus sp. TaxID=58172 RepID=UPI002D25D978|nr:class I SAM-dependent methyltransferase [Paenibacillus sp.]HZG84566.1 class I SAM-dependent methyltransferase [Paenibacillus sp.]